MTQNGMKQESQTKIEAVRERAIRLMKQHESIILDNTDRDLLVNTLASPPEPADTLKRAADRVRL